MEFLSGNAHRDSKRHALDQTQADKKKSTKIAAKLMKEWECEIPKAQLVDYTSPVENAEQWTQLWTRWQPDELVPEVKFKSSLVYLSIRDAGDPNSGEDYFHREPDGTIGTGRVSTCLGFGPTDRARIQFYVVQRN